MPVLPIGPRPSAGINRFRFQGFSDGVMDRAGISAHDWAPLGCVAMMGILGGKIKDDYSARSGIDTKKPSVQWGALRDLFANRTIMDPSGHPAPVLGTGVAAGFKVCADQDVGGHEALFFKLAGISMAAAKGAPGVVLSQFSALSRRSATDPASYGIAVAMTGRKAAFRPMGRNRKGRVRRRHGNWAPRGLWLRRGRGFPEDPPL